MTPAPPVRLLCVPLVIVLSACRAVAPAADSDPAARRTAALDALVSEAIARYKLPGVAVGVVENGAVIYTRTSGELLAGSGQKVDAATVFKIASNTKAMTTALLARLVEQGKLRWEDPVVRHLPQFRMYDPWVTREMQVRDLVIHNSGLRSGAGDLMLWPEPNTFTRADVIAGLAHLKPVHSFRSHYDYDNLLYIVAGEVAAAAAGASYEELLRREVFEPLGLGRCRVGEFRRDELGGVAQPHMSEGGVNVPIRRDGEVIPAVTMAAAGGVRCSLDDMLRWVRVWLDPGNAWLSRAQREALWSAHIAMPLSQRQRDWDGSRFNAYGYGWRLSDVDGMLRVAHTGTLAGMYSAVTLLPERKVGIVLMINGEAGEARTVLMQALTKRFTSQPPHRSIADYAAQLAAERTAAPPAERAPDFPARTPAAATEMGALLGRYVDPWFGPASLCVHEGRVVFSAEKSPKLTGQVMRVGERFLIDWIDPGVDAEAFLDASTNSPPTLRLSKVDPAADFSYDFEDLSFVRSADCTP